MPNIIESLSNYFYRSEFDRYNIYNSELVNDTANGLNYILHECLCDGFELRFLKDNNCPFKRINIKSPFIYPVTIRNNSTYEYLYQYPVFNIKIQDIEKILVSYNPYQRIYAIFQENFDIFGNDVENCCAMAFYASVINSYMSVKISMQGYNAADHLNFTQFINDVSLLANSAVVQHAAFYVLCSQDICIERLDLYDLVWEISNLVWKPIQDEGYFDALFTDRSLSLLDLYDDFRQDT